MMFTLGEREKREISSEDDCRHGERAAVREARNSRFEATRNHVAYLPEGILRIFADEFFRA